MGANTKITFSLEREKIVRNNAWDALRPYQTRTFAAHSKRMALGEIARNIAVDYYPFPRATIARS
jgi:hypothetical protein